jgi:hypothetical protein
VLGISPAAFRMRLSSARRALDRAVAAQAAADANPPRDEPAPSTASSHLKEAVN